MGRVALTPVLIVLLMDPGPVASACAALVFFVASLSDWFDGYLARRSGQVTRLGKFLDPLADKILILGALIMLCAMDREPRVPAWMVAVFTSREIAVTGLRAIARDEGIVLGAETLGKAKTTLETVALVPLILHYRFWQLDFHAAGMAFLWAALALALWSAADYHLKLLRVLRAPQTSALHGSGDAGTVSPGHVSDS